MPYAIEPEERIEDALRRVAQEQAEAALKAVRGRSALGPRVHEMRKSVKKLRGFLRLVRPVFPDSKAENVVLRDAARGLSPLRDAAALLGTLEGLAKGVDKSRRDDLLAPFREAAAHHDSKAGKEILPVFASAMESLRDRSQGWSLKREGWSAIEPGLEATWDATRKALKGARKDPDGEHLHEWRKRAKDHWYQARLLRPIWPAMMDPHVKLADDLGEMLGQIHDLDVLRAKLDDTSLTAALRSEAQDLVDLRRAELLGQALPLGERLFAAKPQALTGLWKGWWKLREVEAA